MELIALCSVCNGRNSTDDVYCVHCRVPLERAVRVSPEEAVDLERRFRVRRRLRRLTRWGIVAAVALLAGALTFWWLGIGRSPPEPLSNISSAPVSAAEWPMAGRDTTHTSTRADGLDISGSIAWTFETAAPFEASPAVVAGVVYAATGDKRVVALNAETGALIWESEVTGPVASSPAVAGDLLYTGLRDGRVIALSTKDGALVWEYQTGDFIVASPTARDGIVYIGSSDRKMYALDALTGEKFWSYKTDGRIRTGASVSDAVVAFVSEDRHVYILDAPSGQFRLDFRVLGQTNGAPVVDDDLVYTSDSRGVVAGIDWHQKQLPFEKTARWARTTLYVWQLVDTLPRPKGFAWSMRQRSEGYIFTPALSGDKLFLASETGALVAAGRSGEGIQWRFEADTRFEAGASVAGDTVYVGDADGTLYAVGAEDGVERWRVALDDGVASEPVIAGNTLYVATETGTLFAIR